MMRANPEWGGRVFVERLFNQKHRFPFCKTSAIADTEDVRIDCESFCTKCCVHDNIGSFAPNTRQRLKRGTVSGDFAAMIADEQF